MDQLVEERYSQAATSFDEVESQHPYSVWATKAQLMAAYALYQNRAITTRRSSPPTASSSCIRATATSPMPIT